MDNSFLPHGSSMGGDDDFLDNNYVAAGGNSDDDKKKLPPASRHKSSSRRKKTSSKRASRLGMEEDGDESLARPPESRSDSRSYASLAYTPDSSSSFPAGRHKNDPTNDSSFIANNNSSSSNVTDQDAKIAKILDKCRKYGYEVDAKDAKQLLEECNGNVNQALALFFEGNKKTPATVGLETETHDGSIERRKHRKSKKSSHHGKKKKKKRSSSKTSSRRAPDKKMDDSILPSLDYTPLSMKQKQDDRVDKDDYLKGKDKLAFTSFPDQHISLAHKGKGEEEEKCEIEPVSNEPIITSFETIARNEPDSQQLVPTATATHNGPMRVPVPRRPELVTIAPGAVAVPGPDAAMYADADEYTISPAPDEASNQSPDPVNQMDPALAWTPRVTVQPFIRAHILEEEEEEDGPQGCCSGCCCDKCCCTMPHGRKVLFPLITLTVASILSMMVLCNCKFLEGGSNYYDYAGLWGGCVYSYYGSSSYGYQDYQEDTARKVAMSFGLIACIVGVTAMVGLWPITCKPYSRVWIHVIGATVVFAFCSQLATFSMFGTEYCSVSSSCRLGWGGVTSLLAAIFYLAGAIGVWMIPKALETNEGAAIGTAAVATETVKITETLQADGTKVTEKVTTAPDGTTTIEKTIEKPLAGGGIEPPRDVESGS